MIQTKIFRRHYAITAVVVVGFIVVGFFISDSVVKAVMSHQSMMMGPSPETFFSHLIDDVKSQTQGDRVLALRHLEEVGHGAMPFHSIILDANGKNISSGESLPFSWNEVRKPTEDYQFQPLRESQGPRMGPPEGLIKFPGTPNQYLYVGGDRGKPPGPPAVFVVAMLSSLLLSVLLGVGFALFLLFRSMREKMTLVDHVIADLQRGNLKARFPISRMDEFGLAMSRFNQMADEIERLVERLRSVEKSRMSLLQDLAHDLRTPVASLKNLLVIIEKKNSLSDQEIRSELLSLSRREVDYFERLVEDLLVLAQVSEPSYQTDQEPVSLIDLIEEESESIFARSELDQKKVEIKNDIDPEHAKVLGDFHLLRRLFRNAIENAHSFAASTVRIWMDESNTHEIKIYIRDDGPGLSAAALKGFGERRVSRAVEKSKGNRLSVGLGSVIMKTVAEIHRGKVSAQNLVDNSGTTLGAEILIVLPQMKK